MESDLTNYMFQKLAKESRFNLMHSAWKHDLENFPSQILIYLSSSSKYLGKSSDELSYWMKIWHKWKLENEISIFWIKKVLLGLLQTNVGFEDLFESTGKKQQESSV